MIVDSRDDAGAPSQADLEVALQVLKEHDARMAALEERMDSIPVRVRAPGGWQLAGKSSAVVTIVALAFVGFVAWLVFSAFRLTLL